MRLKENGVTSALTALHAKPVLGNTRKNRISTTPTRAVRLHVSPQVLLMVAAAFMRHARSLLQYLFVADDYGPCKLLRNRTVVQHLL